MTSVSHLSDRKFVSAMKKRTVAKSATEVMFRTLWLLTNEGCVPQRPGFVCT